MKNLIEFGQKQKQGSVFDAKNQLFVVSLKDDLFCYLFPTKSKNCSRFFGQPHRIQKQQQKTKIPQELTFSLFSHASPSFSLLKEICQKVIDLVLVICLLLLEVENNIS